MREYELIVIFDLSFAEAEGADAGPKYLENIITQNNGNLLKLDHWGRRRMAYPIEGNLDADYVLTRVELEPAAIPEMESSFRINERILRFLTVRADELPTPPAPREEAPAPAAAAPEAPAAPATPEASPASEQVAAPSTAEAPAQPGEVVPTPEAEAPAETDGESSAAGAAEEEAAPGPGSPEGETTENETRAE